MKILARILSAVLLALTFGCDQSQGEPPATNSVIVPDSLLTRRNYYVVFDGSSSMRSGECAKGSSKIKVAKEAVKKFALSLKPEDNLGLLVFDGAGVSERITLDIKNRREFIKAIDAIDATSGTPLYQSIGLAFEKLKVQIQKQLQYGEYHLVVVTDGEANDSDNGLIESINQTPIIIHTIGFCIGQGHSLNRPGKVYYADATSPEAVQKGLKDVLAESDKFK